jgi:hypothetical protein
MHRLDQHPSLPKPTFSNVQSPKSPSSFGDGGFGLSLPLRSLYTNLGKKRLSVSQFSFHSTDFNLMCTYDLCFECSDDICDPIHRYVRWFIQVSPSSLESDTETFWGEEDSMELAKY